MNKLASIIVLSVTAMGCQTSRNDLGPAERQIKPPAEMQKSASPILAHQLEQTRTDGRLTVQSDAFQSGQKIPDPYTAYGQNTSPPLRWSKGPQGTVSYVLLMEDPDANEPKPFVHWIMYNVPAATLDLPTAVPAHARLKMPPDAMQGQNSRGSIGYYGPRPPAGDPPHHYHFQVFALGTMLDLIPGANRETIMSAMNGHVLGKGEVIGTFQYTAEAGTK